MASKTSVSFLVVCGIFLLIFLVALFFLLYYFLRRACLVKAIEIIHTEANQQQNQLSVDRLHVFTESNMTSISAPAVQNDHCKTSSFNVRQTLRKEDIEVTILWQEVLNLATTNCYDEQKTKAKTEDVRETNAESRTAGVTLNATVYSLRLWQNPLNGEVAKTRRCFWS